MVSSFGKSFHVTGWKVGYLVAPEYLMKEIKKVHQFWFQCQSMPGSNKLWMWFHDGIEYVIKRKETSMPCEGTYFQVAFTLQFLLK
jgi:methionine aminotransferase